MSLFNGSYLLQAWDVKMCPFFKRCSHFRKCLSTGFNKVRTLRCVLVSEGVIYVGEVGTRRCVPIGEVSLFQRVLHRWRTRRCVHISFVYRWSWDLRSVLVFQRVLHKSGWDLNTCSC